MGDKEERIPLRGLNSYLKEQKDVSMIVLPSSLE
jgi:hypothetical protein